MKEVTVILDDENLYKALDAEAIKSDRSVQEIVLEAIEQWLMDAQLDEEERTEIEAARKEWRKKGGVESHEFFQRIDQEGSE
jgi:predicted transcriptional regulator